MLLVAGMIPMSTAITKSGAGAMVAEILVGAVGGAGPLALLAGLFVLTVVFGQLISNTATALVVIPIAVSAAAQLGVSARPVLMSVCVAAAAAFLTPVATPANMMVMGPGGYRFGDYWRLGLCWYCCSSPSRSDWSRSCGGSDDAEGKGKGTFLFAVAIALGDRSRRSVTNYEQCMNCVPLRRSGRTDQIVLAMAEEKTQHAPA